MHDLEKRHNDRMMVTREKIIDEVGNELWQNVDACIAGDEKAEDLTMSMYEDASAWAMLADDASEGEDIATWQDIAKRVGQAWVVLGGYPLKDKAAV